MRIKSWGTPPLRVQEDEEEPANKVRRRSPRGRERIKQGVLKGRLRV